MVLAFRFNSPHLDKAISYWRGARYVGALDFVFILAFVLANVLWAAEGDGIPIAQNFMLLLSVPHTFTWLTALTVSTQVPSMPYVLFCHVSYFVAFTLDLGNVIGRLVLTTQATTQLAFNWLCFALAVAMMGVSFSGVVLMGPLMATYREHERAVQTLLHSREQELEMPGFALHFRKVSMGLYESRNILRILTQLDLYLTILLAVMYALGFTQMTNTFQWLTFAQAPHVFLWVLSAGISEGAESSLVLRGYLAALVVDIVLCLGSDVWRIVLAIQCLQQGTPSVPTNCSFLTPFAWVVVAVVVILAVLDGMQLFTMKRLFDGLVDTEKTIGSNMHTYFSQRYQEQQHQSHRTHSD